MARKQLNVNFNQSFLQAVDNKVLLKEITAHFNFTLTFNNLLFNDLTDLMNLITLFILILLHTVSKIGMYGLLYILTY